MTASAQAEAGQSTAVASTLSRASQIASSGDQTQSSGLPMPATPVPPSPPPSQLQAVRRTIAKPVVAAFIAGGVAGAVSRTVVSPLERLKILYQIQHTGRSEYKMSIGKALAKMWREEGWRGFMAGNGTNCIRIMPYSAVQFGSFNYYHRTYENFSGHKLTDRERLMCGAMAGITSVCATYPLDIVRTRLSIQTASFAELKGSKSSGKPPGMWYTMVQMYKNEGGLRAIFRGIIPTVAGVAPYVGLNFMIYEKIRTWFTAPGDTAPTHTRKLLAGAITGALAQTCTYPFDVLRRRFQINTMSGMGYQYTSISGAIRDIVRQEGYAGLYKGLAPNLLKVAPSMAVSWLSFEMTRDFLIGMEASEEAA